MINDQTDVIDHISGTEQNHVIWLRLINPLPCLLFIPYLSGYFHQGGKGAVNIDTGKVRELYA